MSVRAKMKVTSKTGNAEDGGSVRLEAVCDGSDENKNWSKFTPSGHVEMWITNPPAYEAFEAGQEFYIDFTPA